MTTWMTRALLAACVLLGGCADEVPVAKPSPPRVTPATTPATKDEQLPADMQSALEEFARTAAAVALRFMLSVPGVDTAIVGTARPGRIRENAGLVAAGPLHDRDYEAIRARWRAVVGADWGGQV